MIRALFIYVAVAAAVVGPDGAGAAAPSRSKLPPVPVENPGRVDAAITPLMLDAGAALIRSRGWTCDSISAARLIAGKVGYTLRCNDWRYAYDIVDRGGVPVVTLRD